MRVYGLNMILKTVWHSSFPASLAMVMLAAWLLCLVLLTNDSTLLFLYKVAYTCALLYSIDSLFAVKNKKKNFFLIVLFSKYTLIKLKCPRSLLDTHLEAFTCNTFAFHICRPSIVATRCCIVWDMGRDHVYWLNAPHMLLVRAINVLTAQLKFDYWWLLQTSWRQLQQ